jgi:3-oxoadipate enol-lactonase
LSKVRVGDIEIYYEIRGEGETLLYISGTGGDLRRTPAVFDAPVAKHFRILAYDQRGMGQTDKPDKHYTMADYADDANGLLDALGWDSCHIMGVSFGGMVAQELAIRHPEKVRRLVLACTSSGGAGGSSYPLHELQNQPVRERFQRQMELMDNRRDKQWQVANRGQWESMISDYVASQAACSDELGHEIGQRRQLEARRHLDTYDRLPQLKMPVYVCGGLFDDIAPPENLRAIKKQIPNATLELFNGGHPFLSQDPNAWQRVISFLRGERDDVAKK